MFSNLVFYDRKCSLRQIFSCQHISHRVTTKHSTLHRFICKDADPRDTFIAEMRHQYIHRSVFTSHYTIITTTPSEDSTAQRVWSYHMITSNHITLHRRQTSHASQNQKRSRYRNRHTHEHNTWQGTSLRGSTLTWWKKRPAWHQNQDPTPLNPRTLELLNFLLNVETSQHRLNPLPLLPPSPRPLYTPEQPETTLHLNTHAPHMNTKSRNPLFGRTPGLRAECWQGSIGPAMFSTKTGENPKAAWGWQLTMWRSPRFAFQHRVAPSESSDGWKGGGRSWGRRGGGAKTNRFLRRRRRRFTKKKIAPRRHSAAHARHTNIILHHIQNFSLSSNQS